MNVRRAQEIYDSKDMISVHLDDQPVWIENVDAANGMATVQIGQKPIQTKTVSVERLEEVQ
ncbi:H-type small acid-soluble spore protein [Cohnella zeiphila]|uniref:H-type small acid-soluble spore protein n=1 Tax=Cohnella zeiphila TaxID=2761120 RepID=A0A7X0VU89_9BACL|nr:H-type small acid-soluble spore protein [Cohnella zeiphila]